MIDEPVHVHFVSAVRRRMVAWRFLDSLMIAACSGTIVAAICHLFLNAAVWVGAIVTLAVLLLRTIRGGPTSASAAERIDTQFGWNELLQSARAVSLPNDLNSSVAAIANARCAAANISELSLRPFGTGRVTVAAITLLIAAAAWIAPRGRGVARSDATAWVEASPLVDRPVLTDSLVADAVRHPPVSNVPDESSSRQGSAEPNLKPSSTAVAGSPHGNTAAGVGRGAARASSSAASTIAAADVAIRPVPVAGSVPAGDGQGATATAGTHGTSRGVVTPIEPSGVTASITEDARGAPPTADTSEAPASLTHRDADLVRAYFDR